MSDAGTLIFYHCPNTRSSTIRLLLTELDAPYKLVAMSMKKGEHRRPDYLAVNPLGKVPAISHDGQLITETIAIALYLADLFPKAGLAPAIGDRLRGPYLRWMVMYAAAFEPAVVDRGMGRGEVPEDKRGMSTYGSFDALMETINAQLATGPFLLGDRFTAADVIWGSGLTWTTMFKLVPETPVIKAYLGRLATRPSLARHRALEAELSKGIDD